MGSARPEQSQVATSAVISLLSNVSVGMQRVSSLRTQRVAGSSTECEAHKKEHDWQFKESPFANQRPQGRRRDLRLHRCPARRGRPRSRTGQSEARGGRAEREAKHGAAIMQCDLWPVRCCCSTQRKQSTGGQAGIITTGTEVGGWGMSEGQVEPYGLRCAGFGDDEWEENEVEWQVVLLMSRC